MSAACTVLILILILFVFYLLYFFIVAGLPVNSVLYHALMQHLCWYVLKINKLEKMRKKFSNGRLQRHRRDVQIKNSHRK